VLCRALCALLFVAWTAEWPLATDQILYCGHWRSPFQILGPLFVSVPGVNLFPWQLIVVALTPLCLFWPGAFRKRAWPMDGAIVISVASVALTFLWGWMRGGSPYNAYYQLWRFLVGLLVGLLLLSVIRRPRDVKALGLTVLTAALVRGGLCIYFYWEVVRGKIVPPPPYMTTHDDSLLFVAGVLVSASWALARGDRGGLAGHRRGVGWPAVRHRPERSAPGLDRAAPGPGDHVPPSAREGAPQDEAVPSPRLARPAHLRRGGLGPRGGGLRAGSCPRVHQRQRGQLDPGAPGGGPEPPLHDVDGRQPAPRNRLGGAVQKVTSVYANFGAEWWQYAYLPHNSLLATAVFGGLVGITGIWLVVPVAAFLAARGYRGQTRPTVRAGAMAALGILPAYAAQCYGDIGFQSLTGALILGVALAVAGKAAAWAEPFSEERREGCPAPGRRYRGGIGERAMCGIAGAIRSIPEERDSSRPRSERIGVVVERISEAQRHRGPDGYGLWQSSAQEVVFGHRRLAILDLSPAGAQPMVDPESGCAVTFNGEVYNFPAIRRDLEALGETFRSSCDTEVVLKAHKRWGIEAVERFRGIFALALWDPRARAVHLVRDPMGIKPLYWAVYRDDDTGEEVVLFASEVRALLASGAVARHLDPAAVASYLWQGFVVGPNTIVDGIRLLPAASILTIRADAPGRAGDSRSLRQYWRMPSSASRPTTVSELRDELVNAVRMQLVADVPLGVFLSGGIDSSAVAALASEAVPDAVHTFTIGFDLAGYDESVYAQQVADVVKSRHTRAVLTEQGFQEQLPDAFAAIDQPTFDGINTYFVSRAARGAGMTVALAGTGGDEVFGGYPSFVDIPRMLRAGARLPFGDEGGLGSRALDATVTLGARLANRLSWDLLKVAPPQTRWGKVADLARAAHDALGLLPGFLCPLHPRDPGRPRRGSGPEGAARPAARAARGRGGGLARAHRRQPRPATPFLSSSSPASSASACCATPTPPAWPSAWRCACRCSTTFSGRQLPLSIPRVASRRPARSACCASWRSAHSTPCCSSGRSRASCCRSTGGRGSGSNRACRPPSTTPGSRAARACAARPCARCGARSRQDGRASTGRACGRSTCCSPGARRTTWGWPHEAAVPVVAADPSDALGRPAAQLRAGECAAAPRRRGLRVLAGRPEARLPRAAAVGAAGPGRAGSASTWTAARSASSRNTRATRSVCRRCGSPPICERPCCSHGERLLPPLLRARLAWSDVVLADFPFLHPVFETTSAKGSLRVLSTHNLEHRLCPDWLGPAVRRIETRAAAASHIVVSCCSDDRDYFESHAPVRRSVVVPNGTDLRRFQGLAAAQRAAARRVLRIADDVLLLLFTGSKYGPNREAFEYLAGFAADERRLLEERRLHLLVVGGVAQPARLPCLTVTGKVDVVEPYFAAADIALNPIETGAGTNVKMAEFPRGAPADRQHRLRGARLRARARQDGLPVREDRAGGDAVPGARVVRRGARAAAADGGSRVRGERGRHRHGCGGAAAGGGDAPGARAKRAGGGAMAELDRRGHLPALDGVRGLAILMVLLFHFVAQTTATNRLEAGVNWVLSHGLLGVDLFFVLSGFLITGILYDSREQTGYFSSFYMRRALRIFPLYYAVLFVVFFVLPLVPALRGSEIVSLQQHQGWAWLYEVNVFLALQGRLGAVVHRALLVAGRRGALLPGLAAPGVPAGGSAARADGTALLLAALSFAGRGGGRRSSESTRSPSPCSRRSSSTRCAWAASWPWRCASPAARRRCGGQVLPLALAASAALVCRLRAASLLQRRGPRLRARAARRGSSRLLFGALLLEALFAPAASLTGRFFTSGP
jgi:asparagine synthase (glutamine-hydrolysing)